MAVSLSYLSYNAFCLYIETYIQAYLRDVLGSLPDYLNKENISLKQVTQFFGLLVHKKLCLCDSLNVQWNYD